MTFSERIELLIHNPFADLDLWNERADEFAQETLSTCIRDLDDPALAEKALLAAAYVNAMKGSRLDVRGAAKTLPRNASAYVRIANAASRCHRALLTAAGQSDAMRRVRQDVWATCFGDSLYHGLLLEQVIIDHDVLILGETGTGKDGVATAIQLGTPGPTNGDPAPSSALNAASVPQSLLASELFGHVKGAFTGADSAREGRIRAAKSGSFFLDEVGDLEEHTQVKLLRVMETNMIAPLGSNREEEVHVRYIGATHKDLAAMVARDEFRADFYQRLAGLVIELPPLRARRDDIPAISRSFAESYVPSDVFPQIWAHIERWLHRSRTQNYTWPGNVRELQNALRSLMVGLEPRLGEAVAKAPDERLLPPGFAECTATMSDVTDHYLTRVVDKVDGNFAQAARILGIDRATIRRRLKKLGRAQ